MCYGITEYQCRFRYKAVDTESLEIPNFNTYAQNYEGKSIIFF